MMMKKYVMAMLLASAGPHALADEVDDMLSGIGHTTPKTAYVMEIRSAIASELGDVNRFHGKTCTLRLDLRRDGRVAGVLARTGDAAFCDELAGAVLRAKIPPAPDESVWKLIKEPVITLKP